MDTTKRHASQAQVAALLDYMHDHTEMAQGINSGLEREDFEAQWKDLTNTLNSLGGAVKSVEKWKQTWRDLKFNSRKRALLKQQQTMCDTSIGPNSECQDPIQTDNEHYIPLRKKYNASFDEELLKIEKSRLDLEREYKVQKIEVLSRIASALENLAEKK
ncbi:hypothetical protein ACJJTC_011867 [Scirpophaga incertulas]